MTSDNLLPFSFSLMPLGAFINLSILNSVLKLGAYIIISNHTLVKAVYVAYICGLE